MKKQNRRLLIGASIGLALLWWMNQKKISAPPVKPSPTATPDKGPVTQDMVSGYRYHAAI